jgi:hypothetical protein
MRKFLIAAAATTAIFATAGSANAMPGSANGLAVDSPVTNVALCFYLDGWNGPGFYDCGFRYNRGHGWHGKHRSGHHGHHNHNKRVVKKKVIVKKKHKH